ncbi:MAG: trypsin-like peptidase domain-containing protein [Chitinophagales bacterium]|nr:trypsin-like peptidase domain-containing protein [Chitinophagales bacterium]
MKVKNFFLLILSSCLGAIIGISWSKFTPKESLTMEDKTEQVSFQKVNFTGNLSGPDFVAASSIVTPAVVHVNTSYKVDTDKSLQFYGDDFFRYFFGDPKNLQQRESKGSGSGVILSEDGYIITNNHVIENANEINISLSNNKSYKAELIGRDKDTDLALLKIEAKNLPHLNFANSDSVKVGQWVLAVGNPFNLASTVTAGIVSAKGRNIHLLENYEGSSNTAIESFIQTDAAVNPGNSGGALVNPNGDLIGINTAIATPTGSFAGYSFAIPANIAAKVVQDLKEFGIVQRAFIGVNIETVDAEIADELGLSEAKGVLIQSLMPNGAAELAGLQAKDVIVAIEGENILNVAQLQEKLAEYRPGNVIKLSFIRKKELLHATLSLKNKFNKGELLTKQDDLKEDS